MRIYLVEMKEYDYDQYDAFVVVAKDEDDAIAVIKEKHPSRRWSDIDWSGGYTITEVKRNKRIEVLNSFNAG